MSAEESKRTGVIKQTNKGSILVEFPIGEGEKIVDTEAVFRMMSEKKAPPHIPATTVEVILNQPYSPFAHESNPPKLNSELVLKLHGEFTAGDIKKKLSEAHNLPPKAIILYEDFEHHHEIKEEHLRITHKAIYWAFEGDSPANWSYKKNIIQGSLERIKSTVTENIKTASFLLENQWDRSRSIEQQKEKWHSMNIVPYEEHELPKIPILVEQFPHGVYKTSPKDIKEAYYRLNPEWKDTLEKVKERIINVRTDKEQYERNLKNLEKNDQNLREEIKKLNGKIIPPFPDTSLYSSIFYEPEIAEPNDLTWKMLLSTIDANTLYYHQELGKYNILKKEECNLSAIYQQLTTRMKLWIFRERVRLIEWEMHHSELFREDTPENVYLREIRETRALTEIVPDKRKRSYQCIDFCQCEFGCSIKFLSDPPSVWTEKK